MATAAKKAPQDMPPKGGYANFTFSRIPLRPLLSGRLCIGIFTAFSSAMMVLRYYDLKLLEREKFEMLGAAFAILPMVEAERDRAIFKTLRRNREMEAKLMDNIEPWEVGTYFGDAIFKTEPKDKWIDPLFEDLYVFAKSSDYEKRCIQHLL